MSKPQAAVAAPDAHSRLNRARRRLTQPRASRDRYRRLCTLLARLPEIDGLEAALEEILTAAIDLVQADAAYIRLFDPPDWTYPFVAQRGISDAFVQYFGALGRPVDPRARAAIYRGERVIIDDMRTHPAFQPHISHVLAEGYVAMQAIPMISQGAKPIGTICTCYRRRYTPPEEDLQLLEIYAGLAAATIDRQEQAAVQARTEAALREALAVKDEFLGLVSHELRTPMTVIRGLSSVLNRHGDLAQADLDQTYSDLNVESERLHHLIENMLTLARVQAGRAPPLEPISINRLLEGWAETLRTDLEGLVLTLQPLPADETVLGVESHVEQVLHNLVENAYKYSPRGSPVQLSANCCEDSVQISVADQGIGVQDPSSLFQPFHREAKAEQVATGTGLGLAVCKTLVELQGGSIWAESREGGGTTFRFTLQRLPDES
jgi:signal transduction histidine kinase